MELILERMFYKIMGYDVDIIHQIKFIVVKQNLLDNRPIYCDNTKLILHIVSRIFNYNSNY